MAMHVAVTSLAQDKYAWHQCELHNKEGVHWLTAYPWASLLASLGIYSVASSLAHDNDYCGPLSTGSESIAVTVIETTQVLG